MLIIWNINGLANKKEVIGVKLVQLIVFDEKIWGDVGKLRQDGEEAINDELSFVFDIVCVVENVHNYAV